MDKYNVTVIGDGEYEIEADNISFSSASILFHKMGKIEGCFPVKRSSFIIIVEEEENKEDPHIKYKGI